MFAYIIPSDLDFKFIGLDIGFNVEAYNDNIAHQVSRAIKSLESKLSKGPQCMTTCTSHYYRHDYRGDW